MQDIPANTKKRGPSSRVLQEVTRQAPAECHGQPWPEVSRPVSPQRAVSSEP
jgi:hypothetical protein